MKRFLIIYLVLFASSSFAQSELKVYKLKTVLEPYSQNQIRMVIFSSAITPSENEKSGKTPNDLLIRVKRNDDLTNKFSVWIDKNNDGDLNDESPLFLADGEKIMIKTFKTRNSPRDIFEISLQKYKDDFYFYWRRDQRAKGSFQIKNCALDFYLLDLNANGKFDLEENGTGFQLDRNKDGKIWGKDEYFYSREIIEICGENFFISGIDENGGFVEFSPTKLQIAKIGEKTPYFNLKFLDGRQISSGDLIGKKYILDFWASWCVPCVNKLPEIKELESKIPVFYINTDGRSRELLAKEIVAKNDLQKNSVINGLGEDDYLWKTFARINNALPFYVLIDEEGKIIYGGDGGNELKDLKELVFRTKNR